MGLGMDSIDIGSMMTWVTEHKWWLAAIVPIVLVIGVVRGRG